MKKNIDINNSKTKKVKKELDWYIVEAYLCSIENFVVLFRDKKFSKLFHQFQNYVAQKIDEPEEIVDIYAVVECKNESTDFI